MEKKMIEYLENIVNLEKSAYLQRCAIQKITDRINELGLQRNIYKPESPRVYEGELFDGVLYSVIGGWMAGAAIGCLIGAPSLGVCVGPIAGGLICFCVNKNSENKENEERQAAYEQEMINYKQKMSAEQKRLAQEQAEKQSLCETRTMMESKLRETSAVLDQYYGRNIIFPKYRNLVAICSIYEYYLSGRCTSLVGHEGAYNIFETELRLERIYTKLEEIITKLEEIKSNQYILYSAIQEGNRIAGELVDASVRQARLSQKIANSVEASEYYNRQTAIEANQIKWLMLNEKWNNS